MRAYRKWWLLLVAGVLILLLLLVRHHSSPPPANALAIAFVGYTNSPDGRVFALFCTSNEAPYSIRVHGDWVEVASSPEPRAKIINPNLPCRRAPQLSSGESAITAVGDPFYRSGDQPERWRYAMSISRYTTQERALDFMFRHNISPRKIRMLVDDQRILSPTNHVTVCSSWVQPWIQK